MTILALDLGTVTGWALKGKGGAEAHGIWNNKGGRFESDGMRYLRFRGHLQEIHKTVPVRVVYFEEVRRHLGTDAAHIYGGLLAQLKVFCIENQIEYEGIPVATIKKHLTGKGNADKKAMIEAVRKYGYEGVIDDNEADAIAILLLKLEDPVVQRLLAA